jgi:hypothetical protein
MFRTKKDIVKWLEDNYKDDELLYVAVFDKDSIEYHVDEYCLDEKRAAELWEQAGKDADTDDYATESLTVSISEAATSNITEEEVDHANCMPVTDEAGKIVHRRLTALVETEEKA